MTPDKWGIVGTTATIGGAFLLVVLLASWVIAQIAYGRSTWMEGLS